MINSITTTEMECPLCHTRSDVMISRETKYNSYLLLFSKWEDGMLIGKCGNCHEEFEPDRESTYNMLEQLGLAYRRSFQNRNRMSFLLSLVVTYVIIIEIAKIVSSFLN